MMTRRLYFYGSVGAGMLYMLGFSRLVLANDEASELPLPQWSEEDIKGMRDAPAVPFVLGGVLWPGGMAAEAAALPVPAGAGAPSPTVSAAPPATAPLEIADQPGTAQPKTDLSHFMPPELLSTRAAPQPAPPKSQPGVLRAVSSEYLAKAYASPATEHLLDPDGNLGETHSEDIRRFLEFHANDARIDAFILLMAGDERLPDTANLASTAQGELLGREGCLVVYAYGQPSRARLFLSRSVHGGVPAPYLASLLEDCVSDASQASDADDQLHRFLVRLSIRLFWLERMLPPLSPALVAKVASQPMPGTQSELTEIGANPGTTEADSAFLGIQIDERVWAYLGVIVLVLLLGLGGLRWQRYRLRHYVWLLPEPAGLQPRLGGQQCGGSATWVRYR